MVTSGYTNDFVVIEELQEAEIVQKMKFYLLFLLQYLVSVKMSF